MLINPQSFSNTNRKIPITTRDNHTLRTLSQLRKILHILLSQPQLNSILSSFHSNPFSKQLNPFRSRIRFSKNSLSFSFRLQNCTLSFSFSNINISLSFPFRSQNISSFLPFSSIAFLILGGGVISLISYLIQAIPH